MALVFHRDGTPKNASAKSECRKWRASNAGELFAKKRRIQMIAKGKRPVSYRALNPCGQVKGGFFGPGNTCAKGDGTSFATPTSASNCPEPCGMLTPVSDGGELDAVVIVDESATNWSAAKSAPADVIALVQAYTGEYSNEMSEAARSGDIDFKVGESLEDMAPADVIRDFGVPGLVDIDDDGALAKIKEAQQVYSRWKAAESGGDMVTAESFRKAHDVETADDFRDLFDDLVMEHSSTAVAFAPEKTFDSFDAVAKAAFAKARASGRFVYGKVATLDSGLKDIAARANGGKPVVGWRATGPGTAGNWESLAREIKAGDVFTTEGFISTTVDPTIAINFRRKPKTIWRIVGKSGAPVGDISVNPREREILFPHTTKFRVTNVARDVSVSIEDYKTKTGIQVIDLVEIDE